MRKLFTLCIIHQHPRVLLGMKKRGFGAGRWNGFGGKVRDGETIEQAARREITEEVGIRPSVLERSGVIDFRFQKNPEEVLEMHIFRATDFEGEPQETEEMQPQWFHADEIPFHDMWPDDVHWFPLFLSGRKFTGQFLFGEGDAILEQQLQEVREL